MITFTTKNKVNKYISIPAEIVLVGIFDFMEEKELCLKLQLLKAK